MLKELEELKKRVVKTLEKGEDISGLEEEAESNLSNAEEASDILEDIFNLLGNLRMVKKLMILIPLLIFLTGCLTVVWTPYLGHETETKGNIVKIEKSNNKL